MWEVRNRKRTCSVKYKEERRKGGLKHDTNNYRLTDIAKGRFKRKENNYRKQQRVS